MATRKTTRGKDAKTAGAVNEQTGAPVEKEVKGYSGTSDYTSGKVASSDPAQASQERIREDRRNQRGG